MSRFIARWNLLALTFFCLFVVGIPAFAKESGDVQAAEADEDYYELFEVFVDSLDQIERNYVKEISRRELIEAAIEGMVKRLDAHSSYIAPDKVDTFRASVENKFGGIGIQVGMEDDKLTVISPLVGAPAL